MISIAVIKKLTGCLVMGLICMTIVGCSPPESTQKFEAKWEAASEGLEELEGVWIETENETYEVGTTSIRVKWYNTLKDSMLYGESFALEKKVKGIWKQVSKETDINYAFEAIGYILNPDDARWQTYGLICYTDGLTTGEYRLSTTFSRNALDGVDYGAGNYPSYQAYGTFSVGDKSIERTMSILEDTKIE